MTSKKSKNIFAVLLLISLYMFNTNSKIEMMDNVDNCDCGNYDDIPIQHPYDELECKGNGFKKLPELIIGFNQHSWDVGNDKGPEGSNVGITLTDLQIEESMKNLTSPLTNVDVNLISFGGKDNIYWDKNNMFQISKSLDQIIEKGYDGISFDIQEGDARVQDFNKMFQECRDKGLIVKVTTTNFAPIGFSNKQALMKDWITNQNIDIFSPQLFKSDIDNNNNWSGFGGSSSVVSQKDILNITCNPRLCPIVLKTDFYPDAKEKLYNSTGYFLYKNPSLPKKSPYTARCGFSWEDASNNCEIRKACPGGQDAECPSNQHCFDEVLTCNSKYGI